MNIWVISPHDAIPGEPWGQRHAMSLAGALAKRGWSVTYWAASFSHAMKQQRSDGWREVQVDRNMRIVLIPTRPYQKNVSLRRFWFYKDFALGLWRCARTQPRAEILITTLGTPFVDSVVVRLSKLYKAWLITEFRDLWPDVFRLAFPRLLQPVAKILLLPFYWERQYALLNSSAMAAVCQTYLRYAQAVAPNVRHIPTRVIYHSAIQLEQFRGLMRQMEDDSAVPAKQAEDVWAIYAGMLGHTYDVYTLMDAARILSRNPQARNIRIIVAGDGPLRRTLVDFISQHGLRNLIYVGVLDMPGLCRLYARSDIGLCIYAPGSTVVIPAKAFDYYAAALPIVNSLEGEFADYLREQGIGVQYKAGDPVSLASSLVELASNPRRRELMRRRLEEVASVFDRDQQYAKVFDLLPPGLGQTVSTRNDCHHT